MCDACADILRWSIWRRKHPHGSPSLDGGPRRRRGDVRPHLDVGDPHLAHAEREEKCVSVQEHVWGTDGLAKLEAIKAKVDPQGLFQCQKCVGFKGPVRDQ